ncbi:MAG: RHS repeat-associated core domain-containing protein [Verrucomicrobiota bacterium]
MVDAVGTTRYSYTTIGQLLTEDGPWADDTVTYSYHTNGLRKSLSLAQPNKWAWEQTYAYDTGNRLDAITSPAGTFDYHYAASQPSTLVTKLSLPGGSYITNSYDSVSRMLSTALKNSTNGTLNSHAYVYNVGGQRTKQTFTPGNYVDYTYDDIGQLKTAIGKESGGGSRLNEQFGYAYDTAHNLNYRTNNALVQTFNVDAVNQLVSVGRSGLFTVSGLAGAGATNVTVNSQTASLYTDLTFAKDGFSLADGTNTFTAIAQSSSGASATNEISAYLPATASYQYDSNGNLVSDGRRAFAYDDENQLTSVLVTNAWKSEFVYDGKMRRRVRKEYTWTGSAWLQTNEVRYVYDGNLAIQERDDGNAPDVTYSRGRDLSGSLEDAGGIGGLLAHSQHSILNAQPTASHAYYHADGSGNISTLINFQQILIARYYYDVYGNAIARGGTLVDFGRYGFSSKEYHMLSTLTYYGYRFYDANIHRWLTKDPLEDSGARLLQRTGTKNPDFENVYRFVHNDPVNWVDPFGLQWMDPSKPPPWVQPPQPPVPTPAPGSCTTVWACTFVGPPVVTTVCGVSHVTCVYSCTFLKDWPTACSTFTPGVTTMTHSDAFVTTAAVPTCSASQIVLQEFPPPVATKPPWFWPF